MSTIKISDLHSVGSELFKDSESFMNELGDRELSTIQGGGWWSGWECASIVATVAISIASTLECAGASSEICLATVGL